MKYDPSVYPTCTVPASDIQKVKGLGFLRDKTTSDCFNARVITRNGKITADEMYAIADAARRYGKGEVAFTTRQTVEVQGISFENIQPFCRELAKHGLMVGGTGPRVRPIVSCKGTTCVFGLADTYGLSLKIHQRFYVGYHAVKLPHKFKIAVGGCPNNCVKPDINDVGVIGAWVPQLVSENCAGCGACEKVCPVGALKMVDGKPTFADNCLACGRCVRACKKGALEYDGGFRITLGGRWGKLTARGQKLSPLFRTEDEVMDTIEKIILFFRDNGTAGERFADTVARVGFENAEKTILSDEMLQRKEEILEKAL